MMLLSQLRHSDIGRRLAGGALWTFTGTALGKLMVLVAGIVCARLLGKELFGQLGMVRSTVNTFIILGSAGIGVTATRYLSLYRTQQPERIASIYLLTQRFALTMASLVTIAVVIVAEPLAAQALHDATLATAVRWGAVLLFLSVANGALNGTLAGYEHFRDISLNTLIGSLCESVFMVVGAYYWQVEGAILGFGLGVLALYACNKLSVRLLLRKHHISLHRQTIQKGDWRILLHYSLPAALSALTVTPAFWLIRSLLVATDGYEELGAYEAAEQWRIIMLFIPTAISQISLPILSSLLGERTKYQRVLRANILLIGTVAVVVALLTTLVCPLIMALYGSTFVADRLPLIFLAFSTVFTAVSHIMEMSVYSLGRMWINVAFSLLWAAIMVLLTWIFLAKGYGAAALAMAVLLAYAIKCCYMAAYLHFSHAPQQLSVDA